jgi:two-component system OmpR family sensor kinase
MTIRTRLAVWYGIAIAITVSGVSVAVWFRNGAELRSAVDEALAVQAADASANFSAGDGAGALAEDPARPGIFTLVFGRQGTVLGASRSAPQGLTLPHLGVSTWQPPGQPSATALYAMASRDGAVVVAGKSLAPIDDEMSRLADVLAATTAIAMVVSIAGGWLLARRALAPIARITAEADRIDAAEPRLAVRLQAPNPHDELGRLAATLNRLLDRVDQSIHEQRAFVAAASHDLRTPIAALRMELELALRQGADAEELRAAVASALGDVRRLGSLADGLLSLATSEADGRVPDPEPVALRPLFDDAVRLARGAAEGRDAEVQQDVEDAVVLVDRVRLSQAVVNLISNAVRHDPTGRGVQVRARRVTMIGGTGSGDSLEVDVLDRGPGVPEHMVATLFTPFAHPRLGNQGAGLGLATAAAAVRSLGGHIGYRDRPGGGAWFWLRVPTADASPLAVGAAGATRPQPAWSGPRR